MARRLVGFLILLVVFGALERLFVLKRDQKIFRAGWRTDFAHFLFSHILLQVALVVVLFPLTVLVRLAIGDSIQQSILAQPPWLQFVEAVLVADFAFYWAHRMTHRVPFLWKFHAVHHSIEQMDWLASARVHPLDQTFTRTVTAMALFVLGFSRETFGAYLALTGLQALFIHANVRLRFGPLRWLISTPEYHHWHHAREPEAIDKNFGGQFPWLDAIFGTLYLPPRMPFQYGTDTKVPSGYFRQLAFPFRTRSLP
jgi:sterol desaturase/sphingolipid hydroxylase (fatty acid hydroxylase superfamily)